MCVGGLVIINSVFLITRKKRQVLAFEHSHQNIRHIDLKPYKYLAQLLPQFIDISTQLRWSERKQWKCIENERSIVW